MTLNDLPVGFVEMLSRMAGHENVAETLVSVPSPVTVRFNPKKWKHGLPSSQSAIAWEPYGCYLDQRPSFTFMPGLYAGEFYVQDPSSMIVGEAVRRLVDKSDEPLIYLDACAAPGGKTTSAIASLPEGSFVLANEYDSDRARALVENLHRWGATNYAVSRADGRELGALGETFDIVAADVPCSGEGMMRKNETAVTQWSPKLIAECAELQRQIVRSVWETLRPGGYLLYSTCTFNTTENEDNARWIATELKGEPVDLHLSDLPGVTPGLDREIPSVRMLPGHVDGEGQFLAVFRKPGNSQKTPAKNRKESKSEPLPDWLTGSYIGISNKNGDLFAVPERHADLVNHLRKKINVILPGTHVASPKGRELMPAPALATSEALRKDAFPTAEVDYPTSIAYLRGEAIKLEADVPRGYVLVSHRGRPLGWVKNIGNRANNLIPPARRIRSSYFPSEEPQLFTNAF